MIASLSGRLKSVGDGAAIVDVFGIGFRVFVSARTISHFPSVGNPVTLSTYMQVSDAGVALFGFDGDDERALFEQLIVVRGIGPKGALAALSALSPTEIVSAILNEDAAVLQRIPGIGKKTASRIIVELKGSLGDALAPWPELFGGAPDAAPAAVAPNVAASTALEALLSMGFTEDEATLALAGAPESANDVTLIQYALKRLGSG